MFRRGKDKNGDTNGTDDGIYEGAGLESSADRITVWEPVMKEIGQGRRRAAYDREKIMRQNWGSELMNRHGR